MDKKMVPEVRFKGFTDDWEQHKLKNELSLLKDGTHGTHKNVTNGPFLLSAKNVKNGKIIITDDDRKISWDEYHSIHKKFELKKNDVLLTIVGSIGQSAILKNPYGVTFQRSVAYLRPKTMIPYFLEILIQTNRFQSDLRRNQVVSAQPGIYLGDLSRFNIFLPADISEQENISDVLYKLDGIITLQQRQLDLYTKLKKGLLQKLFPKDGENVPEIRFADFHDDWELRKLEQLIEKFIVPMRDKPKEFSGNIPWTRIEDIEGKYLSKSKSNKFVSMETIKKMNLKIIPKNSLIVSISATFGVVAIVTKDLVTNQTFIGLFPKKTITLDFIYALFQTPNVRHELKRESAGSTIFYISKDKIKKMEVIIPHLKEQKQIEKIIIHTDNLIILQRIELDKLKSIKQFLLQKLFI
ncbi:restriction endonuclease subunit S [Companilactobacillus suantsaicola]|uniref:restriction endonuclease subunit S n=1 Tax=Companilactobacillus suantsaicola TaxID=2487723 RepID=UPI00143679B6|nr:restriction endonuclease subunit S [Companilactobacillus suantsaicola]